MVNGDIYPDKFVYDINAIRVNLFSRLSLIKGEYMQNVSLGIPLGAAKDEIDLNVQNTVLSTVGVLGISSFRSTIVNKVYKCTFTANTIYGSLNYEESV